jgi:DNA helicase II / ATP-dependent DNA helicase PcrA
MTHTPTTEQTTVLEAEENLVVLGRPGSGKTSVALWKARRYIERGFSEDFQRVLFLSFSKAAVERMAHESKLELPATLRSSLKLATYHSFCFEILSSHCTLVGLRQPFMTLPPEEERVIKNRHPQSAGGAFALLERTESQVRFDRFSPLCVTLLSRFPRLRLAYSHAYPLILVDEYQDTDDHQDALVRLLGTSSQVICLGDADQRIYDFRDDIRPDRLKRLERIHRFLPVDLGVTNHRNRGTGIREYARSILTGSSISSPAVTLWSTNGTRSHLVKKICQAVGFLRSAGAREGWAVRGRCSLAVMLPTNDLVGQVSRLLRNLPNGERERFRHQVLVDPVDLAVAWEVALTALEDVSAGRSREAATRALHGIARFLRCGTAKTAYSKAERLEKWIAILAGGREPAVAPFLNALRNALETVRLSGQPLQDIREIRTLLEELPGGYCDRCAELLHIRLPGEGEPPLRNALRESLLRNGNYGGAALYGKNLLLQERLIDTERGSAALTLMTLHKCKGREYDGVILAEEANYPNRFVVWSERQAAQHPRSRMLLHVALTRARHRALILTPAYDRSILV